VVFFEAPHRIRQTLEMLQEAAGDARRVAVCREITKRHEELLRGTLSEVITHPSITEPVGEFTCVLEVPAVADEVVQTGDSGLLEEFDRITENGTFERRAAMSEVARRLHVRTRDVFDALERRKASAVEP
jgi:16S rRNA (cytidine1402-2'-O)-methyltransferase